MLEEILSLVRSIDKATNNPTASIASLWLNTASILLGNPIARDLHSKLMAEVSKSSPLIAASLEKASPEFADETLILTFAMYLPTGFEMLTKR
jgi:hypothetical protein